MWIPLLLNDVSGIGKSANANWSYHDEVMDPNGMSAITMTATTETDAWRQMHPEDEGIEMLLIRSSSCTEVPMIRYS